MPETEDTTTPLLVDSEPLESGEYEIHNVQTMPRKPPYLRATIILTHAAAAFSAVALIFDLTAIILNGISPHDVYLFYRLDEGVRCLVMVNIVSVIASALNLTRLRRTRRSLPLLINLVFDGLIVFLTSTYAPDGVARNLEQDPNYWGPDADAVATATALQIIVGVGMGCSLVAGLAHLALFGLRLYGSFKAGAWRSPQTWKLPGGELKLEFSVRFRRQEGAAPAPRAEQHAPLIE
ncbi:hypothetical protein ARAM_004502 [Aspergillus rambellii]|uniref:Uncharacterized protein n=1 Tax=Aspergillus rambellii TaxID=308745 RepID=A0A0F8XBC3_9EURO|nr:hypothetical protein ARAM_004502 [Aspergillus rambellii]